jgi:hypothetical protein
MEDCINRLTNQIKAKTDNLPTDPASNSHTDSAIARISPDPMNYLRIINVNAQLSGSGDTYQILPRFPLINNHQQYSTSNLPTVSSSYPVFGATLNLTASGIDQDAVTVYCDNVNTLSSNHWDLHNGVNILDISCGAMYLNINTMTGTDCSVKACTGTDQVSINGKLIYNLA